MVFGIVFGAAFFIGLALFVRAVNKTAPGGENDPRRQVPPAEDKSNNVKKFPPRRRGK